MPETRLTEHPTPSGLARASVDSVLRRGAWADVMTAALDACLEDVVHEAGVRKQL